MRITIRPTEAILVCLCDMGGPTHLTQERTKLSEVSAKLRNIDGIDKTEIDAFVKWLGSTSGPCMRSVGDAFEVSAEDDGGVMVVVVLV